MDKTSLAIIYRLNMRLLRVERRLTEINRHVELLAEDLSKLKKIYVET
jgi:hypothetical protein